MTQLSASLPALMDATAIAYARRFTAAQLDEVTSFYRTPTGRSFVDQLPAVMADPAMAAVQRDMMTGAMSTLRTDVQSFVGELAAAESGR